MRGVEGIRRNLGMAVPLQELRDAQDSGPGAQAALSIRDIPAPGRVLVCLFICFALLVPEMPLRVSPACQLSTALQRCSS